MTAQSRQTITSLRLQAARRVHVLAITVLPLCGFIFAIYRMATQGIGAMEIWLLLGMWFVSGLGITVGFHRLFAHRAFQADAPVQVILIILGSMAAQGSLVYWVALHRRHHQHADKPGDPHSPHLLQGRYAGLRGFWHAHIGWMFDHEIPNPGHYAVDLLRQPIVTKTSNLYYFWVALGLILPALIGGLWTGTLAGAFSGLLWGGLVRLFLGEHFIWSVNSIAHLFGGRPFNTGEYSTNNAWLAIPTLGESWHNNHHAFSNSALFGLERWQIDLGGWTILALAKVGLVRNVRIPERALVMAHKACNKNV